jgi:hypothetical protein
MRRLHVIGAPTSAGAYASFDYWVDHAQGDIYWTPPRFPDDVRLIVD